MKLLCRIGMFAVICVTLSASAAGQESRQARPVLELDEAVGLARERAPERRRQEAVRARKQAMHSAAGMLPNPVVSYAREDLRNGSNGYSEWIATAEYPLVALLLRAPRLGAADLGVRAAEAELARSLTTIAFEARMRFVEVWKSREKLRVLDGIEPRIRALEQAVTERVQEGDISVYEQRRLQAELASIRWHRTAAAQERRSAEDALAGLLMLPPDSLQGLELVLPELDSVSLDIPELVRDARRHRRDIEALRLSRDALSKENAWLRWTWVGDIRIGGGYKRQSDLFSGPVLSISAPLPLFDREQPRIQENEAQQAYLEADHDSRVREAEMDIRNAVTSYRLIRASRAAMPLSDPAAYAELLATATEAYREGEFSLIEYLDAVTAYVDGTQLVNTARAAELQAAFKLEHAFGNDLFPRLNPTR